VSTTVTTNQKLDLARIQAEANKNKKEEENKNEEYDLSDVSLVRRGTIGINSTAGMFF